MTRNELQEFSKTLNKALDNGFNRLNKTLDKALNKMIIYNATIVGIIVTIAELAK